MEGRARYQAWRQRLYGPVAVRSVLSVAMRPCAALALSVGRVSREVAAFLSIFSLAIESAVTMGRSRGGLREAHLPTKQSSPRQEARLPPPDEHPRRASRADSTSRQGPAQPVGLIWRIRERSAFTRLAREGRRTRAGVLWCTYLPDPSATPPRVAYALGRAIGPAVVRNRLRRQLRGLLDNASLPPGLYLIGARPDAAQRSRVELEFDLQRLVDSVAG